MHPRPPDSELAELLSLALDVPGLGSAPVGLQTAISLDYPACALQRAVAPDDCRVRLRPLGAPPAVCWNRNRNSTFMAGERPETIAREVRHRLQVARGYLQRIAKSSGVVDTQGIGDRASALLSRIEAELHGQERGSHYLAFQLTRELRTRLYLVALATTACKALTMSREQA